VAKPAFFVTSSKSSVTSQMERSTSILRHCW